MTKTKIPWCDFVWNCVVGCSPVGEGCRNCFAHTLHTMRHKAYMAGKKLPAQYAKPFSVVQCLPERLDAPRRPGPPRPHTPPAPREPLPPVPDVERLHALHERAKAKKVLLISVRPEHATRIFNGEKTVELRRVRPRLDAGDTVIVYVTAPVMALAGEFEVSEVLSCSPGSLWRKVGPRTGLSRAEFDGYFNGSRAAYGIGVSRCWRFSCPAKLETLRKLVPGFAPPLGYWYMPPVMLRSLKGNGRLERAVKPNATEPEQKP